MRNSTLSGLQVERFPLFSKLILVGFKETSIIKRLSTIQGCLFRGVLLYIYLMVKFYSYNPTNNFNIYLWNGVLLGQPFHNQHARLSQPCEVVNTLHEIPQTCDNLSRL